MSRRASLSGGPASLPPHKATPENPLKVNDGVACVACVASIPGPSGCVICTLADRGIRLTVEHGGIVAIGALDRLTSEDRHAIRRHKAALVKALAAQAAPPDPTPPATPCATCGSVVWWQADGTTELHCADCTPCPDRAAARWYTSPTSAVDLIVTELMSDPLVRRALSWAARSTPVLADRVIAALGRIDRAGLTDTPVSNLFGQLEDAVDAVLRADAGLDELPHGPATEVRQ